TNSTNSASTSTAAGETPNPLIAFKDYSSSSAEGGVMKDDGAFDLYEQGLNVRRHGNLEARKK
ncbi:hypothetical protein E4U54_003988, partial [Claviceps lovelessii]